MSNHPEDLHSIPDPRNAMPGRITPIRIEDVPPDLTRLVGNLVRHFHHGTFVRCDKCFSTARLVLAESTEAIKSYPMRNDPVEQWLRDQRDACPALSPAWTALDDAVDRYRQLADTGARLTGEPGPEPEAKTVNVVSTPQHLNGDLDAIFDAAVDRGHRSVAASGLAIVADPPRSALARWLDSHSLVAALVGKRATGKTVAAQAVGKEVLDRENDVRYWHLDELAAGTRFGPTLGALDDAASVELLIVDDVGDVREAKAWNMLARIVSLRMDAGLKTLLVTYDRHIFHYAQFLLAPPAETAFGNVEIIAMDPFGDARG